MNQLATIQNLTPAEIYTTEKVDQILTKIAEEAKAVHVDVTTVAGRKEIASIAYKIAQSKTFMDDCGKKLGEDWKKKLDTINAERKKIRDTLDALKEEIRQPLTEWEKQDEARKAKLKERIISIQNISNQIAEQWQTLEPEMMGNRLELVQSFDNWQEFEEEAKLQIAIGVEKISSAINRRSEYDKQQEELKALRLEKEEREKAEAARIEKEREEARLLAEAEARNKAEELAKKEAAEQEQKRIEREKQVAIEKEQAIAREKELADKRVKEAEARAAREKEEAILKERKRVEEEKRAAEAAEQKRQANLKHRAKINNEILSALMAQGFDEEHGKKIITVIVSGLIPHTKITY